MRLAISSGYRAFHSRAAKKLVGEADIEQFISCEQELGYSYLEVKQNYAAIDQRWLVVQSRREADLKKINNKIDKDLRVSQGKFKELMSQKFASRCYKSCKKVIKKVIGS